MHHHEEIDASKRKRKSCRYLPDRSPVFAGSPIRVLLEWRDRHPRLSRAPCVRSSGRHREVQFRIPYKPREPDALDV
uniref:Uncharacterized protein n=1 Tax=Candidatus Methanogaster sp. ANME-2c ERB4 TaxID=2759911 RepID=A0A7G9Y7M3_9EURY|nr:hypothetical protein JJJHGJFO_00003 [Methanosarcinales archaeon ANME-2c ERB4]